MKIPFCKPCVGKEEAQAAYDVIMSGNMACGNKVKEFEEKFAEYVGAKYAVAFNGCTSALWSALKVSGIRNTDKIAIPAITYTATASVVVEHGATPVFCDIDKSDFCMKWDNLEADFFIPVHLTGNLALGPSLSYSGGENIVFDSAHRIEKDDLRDKREEKRVTKFHSDQSESIWCYSFYATKNMTTGYGGMACTNDEEYYNNLKLIQDDGRIKSKPTYTVEIAVGGRDMNDIAAAIGLEQLKKLPWITERRNEIVRRYNTNLALRRSGNHLYPVLVSARNQFIEAMALVGIQCSIHFKPLHLEPAYKKYCNYSLPNAEYVGERLVSLPLFPTMTDEEVDYVSDEVLKTGLLLND